MINTIRKLFSLFSENERRKIYWLLIAIVLMGIIEVTGVVSIMPFMAMVADPDMAFKNTFLQNIYSGLGFSSQNAFMFFLGIVVLTVLAISNLISAVVTWSILKFTQLCGHTLSERLLRNYLSKPYAFFLNRNSSELSKNILSEVNRVIVGVLMPIMMSIMKLVAATFILVMLVLVNPLLAFTVIAVIGAAYVLIYLLVRKRLAFYGEKIGMLAGDRFKFASEAFGGIKDTKLLGKEDEFVNRFSKPSQTFAIFYASSQIITQLPRFALEVIAFGGILLIVLYLLKGGQNISEAMPIIALYAFAGYRLMPALQVLYSNMSTLRYNYNALELLHNDFSQFQNKSRIIKNKSINVTSELMIEFEDKIKLENIIYAYPNTNENIINNLDLTIHKNTTVGIVGSTGSGKTTIIDIILGLLEPGSGTISVDGIPLDRNNIREWQKNLGYVPQSIYLTDDTLKKNIAFGVPEEEIDNNALIKAADIANISDFIRNELPEGFDTIVGERGVRLSGGQRQRIGIARALYRNPKVLILDEATSALDGKTESAIIDAINKLSHKKTIIMIAHRLTTVMTCDVIYILEKGKIVDSGTYSKLIETSASFKKLANIGLNKQ